MSAPPAAKFILFKEASFHICIENTRQVTYLQSSGSTRHRGDNNGACCGDADRDILSMVFIVRMWLWRERVWSVRDWRRGQLKREWEIVCLWCISASVGTDFSFSHSFTIQITDQRDYFTEKLLDCFLTRTVSALTHWHLRGQRTSAYVYPHLNPIMTSLLLAAIYWYTIYRQGACVLGRHKYRRLLCLSGNDHPRSKPLRRQTRHNSCTPSPGPNLSPNITCISSHPVPIDWQ